LLLAQAVKPAKAIRHDRNNVFIWGGLF